MDLGRKEASETHNIGNFTLILYKYLLWDFKSSFKSTTVCDFLRQIIISLFFSFFFSGM